MNMSLREQFLKRWASYFPGSDLPICFYYADDPRGVETASSDPTWRCLIGDLGRVRKGQSLAFALDSITCSGGNTYSGFSKSRRPNFNYFLSCGLEGVIEGERYKKSPELVEETMRHQPSFEAPGRYLIFKRFDHLVADDSPMVAVFFATPDVLAGLFTLSNYDEAEPNMVMAPFGAGCSSIVYWPLHELTAVHPRSVIGMFDVSARPYVPADRLTFAVPWTKFERMIANMGESFLITDSWKKVQTRLAQGSRE
jgi:hypothetical protein